MRRSSYGRLNDPYPLNSTVSACGVLEVKKEKIMKEELISFETAKLAKEKGFDIDCGKGYYLTGGNRVNGFREIINYKYDPQFYWRPTQSLLQKWLREEKRLHIVVNIGIPHGENKCHFYSNVIKFGKQHKSKFKSKFYKSFEEAQETGLQEALKQLSQ